MSIVLRNSRKIIIDRSLLEVTNKLKEINRDVSREFLILLKGLGVDIIEINDVVLNKVKNLPENLDYIYRIDNISNLHFIDRYKMNFKCLVIDYKELLNLNKEILNRLRNSRIMIEVDIKAIDQLCLEKNIEIFNKLDVECVRIKGVIKYDIYGLDRLIENIRRYFSSNVDLCADSGFYMATAISIEACMDGADSITAAFNGQIYGLAALEEVILGLKVIKNGKLSGDLKVIKKLTKVYEKLSYEKIYCMKPVIGEDIFKCESGIHVDGMEKDPNTYEPYNPYDIGSIRTVYIGKHSGKKSVMIKLKKLNIDYRNINVNEILKKVRETSIKLNRNVFDDELIQICNDLKDTCLK